MGPAIRGPAPSPEPSETPISTHPNQPQYGPDGRPVGPEAGDGQDLLGSAPSHPDGQHPTSGPQQPHGAPAGGRPPLPPNSFPPHAQPSGPQAPPYPSGPQQGYPGGPGGPLAHGGPGGPQQEHPPFPGGPPSAPTGGQAPLRPGPPPHAGPSGGHLPPHGGPTGGHLPPYAAPGDGRPGVGHLTQSGPHQPPGQTLPPGPLPYGQGTVPPHVQGRPGPPPGAQPPGRPQGPPAPGQTPPPGRPSGGRVNPYGTPPGGPGMPPGGPGRPTAALPPGTSPQQAFQAPPRGPAGGQPGSGDPVFPPDAMGVTQNIHAVPAAPGKRDERPLYRDEVPDDAGADTAQFDVQGVRDYENYDDYAGDDDGYTDTRAKKRRLLIVAGFAVLLVVAGGGTFLLASGGGGTDSGGATAATVADEADDPGALAAEDLFPETLDVEGGTFTRVAVDDVEDCSAGAHGDYGQVLADNECRQMVRASYLSEDEGHAVTIGVAAMPSDEEAATAMDAQDLVGAQWFAGLAGEEGSPAERLGHAGGHGSSGQWGRYLLFALATNSDGSEEGSEESDSATELRTIGDGFLDEAFGSLSEERA